MQKEMNTVNLYQKVLKMEINENKVEEVKRSEFERLRSLNAHGDENGNFIVNGKRLMFLGADYFMAEILDTLKKYTGPSAGAVLYNIGVEIGKEYFDEHVKEDDKDEALGKFLGFMVFSGYSEIKTSDNKVVIKSSPTAVMSKRLNLGNHKTCYFIAGVIAGFLSKLFNKQIDVRETKCLAEGNEHCEFEIFE